MLEGDVELIVSNAHHIKNVPGRKTDVKDSEWIADLVRHGLIAKSFVPPKPIRELRDLLRYRRNAVKLSDRRRDVLGYFEGFSHRAMVRRSSPVRRAVSAMFWPVSTSSGEVH